MVALPSSGNGRSDPFLAVRRLENPRGAICYCGSLSVALQEVPREGRTADQHDAYSIAAWMRQADLNGDLTTFFEPHLTPAMRAVAQVEGWILGIK